MLACVWMFIWMLTPDGRPLLPQNLAGDVIATLCFGVKIFIIILFIFCSIFALFCTWWSETVFIIFIELLSLNRNEPPRMSSHAENAKCKTEMHDIDNVSARWWKFYMFTYLLVNRIKLIKSQMDNVNRNKNKYKIHLIWKKRVHCLCFYVMFRRFNSCLDTSEFKVGRKTKINQMIINLVL